MDEIIKRLSARWFVKQQFLKDVYFLMKNDLRFSSGRSISGIRYVKTSQYLADNYGIDIKPRQLKYLVCTIKKRK